jgi:hypothetical protein
VRRAALPAVLAVVSCGGSSSSPAPSDISGDYTITVTDGANACMFTNFMQGHVTTNVGVTIVQQGSSATGTVTGLAAGTLDILLGTSSFEGTVSGDSFTLTAIGSNPYKVGMCAFTVKGTITGSITGDAIQGTVTYTETTNGSSDCTYENTCSTVQDFAGVRAPDAGIAPADAGSGG